MSHKNLIEPHFEGVKEKFEPVLSVVIEEETIKEETPEEIELSDTKSQDKDLNFADFMDQMRSKPVQQNFAEFMDKMKTEEVETEVRETTFINTTEIHETETNIV